MSIILVLNNLHEIYSCRRSNSSGESLFQSNRFMNDDRRANLSHSSLDCEKFDMSFVQQTRVCFFVNLSLLFKSSKRREKHKTSSLTNMLTYS